MNYNPTIGKIYDTIFFLTEYFNGSITAHDNEQQHDIVEMLEYYATIKQEVQVIPYYLKPFFFCNATSLSILTKYFYLYLGNKFSHFDEFIISIKQDSDIFRSQLVSSLDIMDDDTKNA